MRFSKLFTKTLREAPADEVAVNAKLLTRGGFVYKNSAGIYTYLPLGWRVLEKIRSIIRQEMDSVDGQEIYMQALVEKKYMESTGRWEMSESFEARGIKEESANFVMGWTHEEVIAAISQKFISSYKDLPFAAYQIQTKFRNEPRAKSGLLRCREFLMKDLYSFHASEDDLWRYYEAVHHAYTRIFDRVGVHAIYTLAAGGEFTVSNTHEFQVVTPVGEDTIYVCAQCEYSENKEISQLAEGSQCPKCSGDIHEHKSVEVGNIFPLGTRYSKALGLQFSDDQGEHHDVIMGSYGIGLGRLMATVVEVHHDDKGIIWPVAIAPFQVHLIVLDSVSRVRADALYQELMSQGFEVLYDDREDKTAGEKFADADLIGIPTRLVVSKRTLEKDSVEIKKRSEADSKLVPLTSCKDLL